MYICVFGISISLFSVVFRNEFETSDSVVFMFFIFFIFFIAALICESNGLNLNVSGK